MLAHEWRVDWSEETRRIALLGAVCAGAEFVIRVFVFGSSFGVVQLAPSVSLWSVIVIFTEYTLLEAHMGWALQVKSVVVLGPDGVPEQRLTGRAVPPDEPIRPRKYIPWLITALVLWFVSVAMVEILLEPIACKDEWSGHGRVIFALVWVAAGIAASLAWLALLKRD